MFTTNLFIISIPQRMLITISFSAFTRSVTSASCRITRSDPSAERLMSTLTGYFAGHYNILRIEPAMMRIVTLIVLIWLIVGAVAAGQRGYYSSSPTNCAGVGTIAPTVNAAPLTYFGVNPKVTDCTLPHTTE